MKTNLRQITGNWNAGFVLDKHTIQSELAGHNQWGQPEWNTTRSEAGEALFQLKYRADFSQAVPLAEELASSIYPKFHEVGRIIPMPASSPRNRQPVTAIAEALGRIVDRPVFDELLTKVANGQQLKDLHTKEEKQAALAGTFTVHEGITTDGCWNALLIDDLFDTGATVEAACAALRGYHKISKIYVAAITWK